MRWTESALGGGEVDKHYETLMTQRVTTNHENNRLLPSLRAKRSNPVIEIAELVLSLSEESRPSLLRLRLATAMLLAMTRKNDEVKLFSYRSH